MGRRIIDDVHLNSDRSQAAAKATSNQPSSFASIFRPSPSPPPWRGDDWLASTHTPTDVGSRARATANGDGLRQSWAANMLAITKGQLHPGSIVVALSPINEMVLQ